MLIVKEVFGFLGRGGFIVGVLIIKGVCGYYIEC